MSRTVKRKTEKSKLINTSEEISAMEACEMCRENFYVCNAEVNHDPLPGKELLEPVRTLKRKSASDWTERDIMPLAELLAGRIVASEHPKIRSIIDPVYVTIDLTTCAGNVPPAVDAYPPVASPHPPLALFPGTNHIFVFMGPGALNSAQHFMGWLQGTYVGLRAVLQNSILPAILY